MMERPGLPTTSPMIRMFMVSGEARRARREPRSVVRPSPCGQIPGDIIGRADPLELTETLLALAAATTWDGGEGVLAALREALSVAAPFDAGELALFMPTGYRRWTFTGDEDPLAGDDVLLYVCRRDARLRSDQPEAADAFPEPAAGRPRR